ncbi:MAG: response regulator [Acetobacteraceae bacterium]
MSLQETNDSSKTRARVLVVEDEFLIRLTLSEVLADEGYDVLEAETGDAALVLLENDPSISVLLTDVQLPGSLDGRALVQRVRQTIPDLPVIYMTGRPDSMTGQATGAREMYVAKPYLPSDICAAIQRMLEG